MKKNQKKQQSNNYKKFFAPIYKGVALLSIILLFASVLVIYREYKNQMDMQAKKDVAFQISKAIEGLIQDAPTASYSNQQFIDSAKVKFSRTEATSLVYSYTPYDTENEQSENIQLSSRSLVNYSMSRLNNTLSFSEMLNLVPSVQKCSRLFIVTFDDKVPYYYSDYSKINTILLADNRTAYIWKASGELCIGAEDSFGDELVSVINTIQSY
jgi:hypothetical protein